MLQHCPYPTGYFYKRADTKRLVKVPKGCGRWDCPYCGERKKKKLLDRIATYFRAHPDQCRMLTLTLGDNYDDAQITEAWNRLKASLRKYGHRFAYCWFKEFTVKGRRHMHVLLDRFIPRKLIKRLWLRATEYTSYIVKINHRPIRSAAGYCSKYVTKDIQNEARYAYKERRYTFSRDFNLPREASTGEWAYEHDGGKFRFQDPADKLPSSRIREIRQEWNDLQAKKRAEQGG